MIAKMESVVYHLGRWLCQELAPPLWGTSAGAELTWSLFLDPPLKEPALVVRIRYHEHAHPHLDNV
jgi:hypothetical protein